MRSRLAHLLQRYGVLAYFIGWGSYFAAFWSRAVSYDPQGNLIANHVNIWGDWAAHFTMGSSLAYRSLWLTDSPLLLGTRFSYPYISDWISAVMIKAGVGFLPAFTIPSFFASCLLVVTLFYFFKTLFKSRTIAILASMIFLLNGGLGFIEFGYDVANSTQPLTTLLNPPHEYTRIDALGIKWLSVIDSMVIPQRAFTLGFPLTLLALTWVYQSFYRAKKIDRRRLVGAGIILGAMPLIHTHSFLAAGIILSFWLVTDLLQHRKTLLPRLMNWTLLGGVSLVLAVPIFVYFFADQVHGFIRWYPGWLANEYHVSWPLFWLRNWAFTPMLAVVGYWVWLKKQTLLSLKKLPLALIWAPFFGLFIAANLWLFQPFSWDNTKLIVWAALGFSGLVGYLFDTQSRSLLGKVIVIPLFLMTIASGSIDTYRILRIELHQYQMFSAEEVQLAEWVRTQTPANAIWLTGNQHNHWLFNLSGRQAVMTYPGWLWTHGYDYLGVESDLHHVYQQPTATEILDKYQIQYVVVGPEEINKLGASKLVWQKYYPEIKTTANYSLFQIQ